METKTDSAFASSSLVERYMPDPPWRWPFIIALGAFCGLGLFTIVISNAVSYISDDPKACVNCHNMTTQYSTWMHSSHREVAMCNDCHVPHNNIVNEYFFHAKDGLRHTAVFTLGIEPQVYELTSEAAEVVQYNCKRCHEHTVSQVAAMNVDGRNFEAEGQLCWQCHRQTPHGQVASQASTPFSMVPDTKHAVADFIKKELNEKSNKNK